MKTENKKIKKQSGKTKTAAMYHYSTATHGQ
jgi:hypothetical protein